MAVRLLAGPFPLTDEEGVFPTTMHVAAWYPHVGLLCTGYFPYYQSFRTHIATMDGVLIRSITFRPVWSWWPSQNRMVVSGFGGGELVFEPKALMWQYTHPDHQVELIYRYVKLEDRRVYFTGRKVHSASLDGVPYGPESEEIFFSGEIHPGPSNTVVFIEGQGASSNRGRFYDTVTHKAMPVMYLGIPCDRIVYAPEYGVLITGHAHDATYEEPWEYAVRVWSLEVHPTILTDPVAFIGTPKSGQVVTYRVRLTGAQNDPAAGEFVNWWVTGAGTLLDLQSTTDANGYATARVQYQVGETGESVVEASVAC